MSALSDRDMNVQPTSQPSSEGKKTGDGMEDKTLDGSENKQSVEQRFAAINA